MITIRASKIEKSDENYTLSSIIDIDGAEQLLWYRVQKEYGAYLTEGRADPFLTVVLLKAMKENHDIVCEDPVSEKLLYSFRETLIPFLAHINKELHEIQISGISTDAILENENHIGTAVSCGVDSLSTIIHHGLEETSENYRIDTLTLFNSGYYGNGQLSREVFKEYQKQSVDFCREFNYNFLTADCNVRDFLVYKFGAQFTYMTCSVVLALQKYFKRYYFSSGYPFYRMEAKFQSSAYYECILLDAVSTENVTINSGCSCFDRAAKTKLVYDHTKIFNYVFPCLSGDPAKNCGKCEKCIRAIMTYDAYGLIDKIGARFNTKYYRSKRAFLISCMIVERHKALSAHSIFNEEIYRTFKENTKIPLSARLLVPVSFIYVVFKNLFRGIKGLLKSKLSVGQRKKLKKLLGGK